MTKNMFTTKALVLSSVLFTSMFVFFLMKASPTLVLAIIITVYGFVQPYKSRTANLLEMGVQVNFLLLLLIEATSNIRELYFTFPPLLQSNVTSEPECVDSPTGNCTNHVDPDALLLPTTACVLQWLQVLPSLST